jgi:hypothetical protein
MSNFNSEARGCFVPLAREQTVEADGSPVFGADPAARSPIWRTAVHESGHILCEKYLGFEVSGSTVAEGPGYSGMTWGPESLRAKRGKVACDDAGTRTPNACIADVGSQSADTIKLSFRSPTCFEMASGLIRPVPDGRPQIPVSRLRQQ